MMQTRETSNGPDGLRTATLRVDFCVVGGGMAGLCAAVTAARQGMHTALIHDRPVLGGNASSEVRVWISGAKGKNNMETGLIEEIRLENRYRNPGGNWSLWDTVLYEKARFQSGLELALNASVCAAEMDGQRIRAVRAWQSTTQTWLRVEAALFADCSGDSILAPLTGAETRWGREARDEFGETIQPEKADRLTMGMSCLIQARETGQPQTFIPPSWANRYETDADLPYRRHKLPGNNFWWIEIGGEQDAIRDAEQSRDELLKIALGVWDHIKNRGDHGAANWALDWIGFLPGKRESRRYVGDHLLTQNDIQGKRVFPDAIAYGAWPLDDHHPAGIKHPGKPAICHPVPEFYGIPYRCLYSRTIANLFCAGRNISVTHVALAGTRVMATCALLGEAVGQAAALAGAGGTPRGVGQKQIERLQQKLLEGDAYLPGIRRQIAALTVRAGLTASTGDPEPLRNGWDRPIGNADNVWHGRPGLDWVGYEWAEAATVRRMRFIFDSDLNRGYVDMRCDYPLQQIPRGVPPSLIRSFRVDALDESGAWRTVYSVADNYQRRVAAPQSFRTRAVRFYPLQTWGAERATLFAWDVDS